MKRLVFALVMVFVLTGTVMAKDFEVTKKAGDYTVKVIMDKNPPVTGENIASVAIKDKSGVDVKDAKVTIVYSMPAMPGMPAMKYSADAVSKGSVYLAKLNFSMSGAWDVAVQISHSEKKVQTKFNVDVR